MLAPTLIDVARAAGRRVAVVGPTDFAELYGVKPGPTVSLRPWPKGGYLSGTLVDDALAHRQGDRSRSFWWCTFRTSMRPGTRSAAPPHEYREVAGKVDADIARLVSGLQADTTTFVIVADHGHIATGGHGGWEREVVTVPGIFSGAAVRLGSATGTLPQVAPTVAVLSGIRVPAVRRVDRAALGTQHHVREGVRIASRRTTSRSTPTTPPWSSGDDVPPAMFAQGRGRARRP